MASVRVGSQWSQCESATVLRKPRFRRTAEIMSTPIRMELSSDMLPRLLADMEAESSELGRSDDMVSVKGEEMIEEKWWNSERK